MILPNKDCENLVMNRRDRFDSVSPKALDNKRVGVLWRMVGHKVRDLVDLWPKDRSSGHSNNILNW